MKISSGSLKFIIIGLIGILYLLTYNFIEFDFSNNHLNYQISINSIKSLTLKKFNITSLNFHQPYTTVVSLYFPLQKSKHSLGEYSNWTRNALLSIEAPLVLFTTLEIKQAFIKIRPNNTLFFVYENHWALLKEIEEYRNMNYTDNYRHKQRLMDPEKHIHVNDLYVIWNSKAYIMEKIARINPYKSSFIIYSDLGAWRCCQIPNWPDKNFVRIVNERLNGRLLFGQTAHVNNESEVNINGNYIEGGFFAGTPQAIIEYAKLFYEVHDKRFTEGLFIGKDQTIMNYIAYKTNPKNYVRLRTLDMHVCNQNPNDKKIYFDLWFFYQHYFSKQIIFNCSYDKKLSILTYL
jgi:hypothetical protein